jgi:hypothetical protein
MAHPAPINPAPIGPVEPTFDKSPAPFGAGLPDPVICDAAPRDLRQRTVNFAAKRMTDMRYVSGLDRETAERHFRWRPAVAPGGLSARTRRRTRLYSGRCSARATLSSTRTMPTAGSR